MKLYVQLSKQFSEEFQGIMATAYQILNKTDKSSIDLYFYFNQIKKEIKLFPIIENQKTTPFIINISSQYFLKTNTSHQKQNGQQQYFIQILQPLSFFQFMKNKTAKQPKHPIVLNLKKEDNVRKLSLKCTQKFNCMINIGKPTKINSELAKDILEYFNSLINKQLVCFWQQNDGVLINSLATIGQIGSYNQLGFNQFNQIYLYLELYNHNIEINKQNDDSNQNKEKHDQNNINEQQIKLSQLTVVCCQSKKKAELYMNAQFNPEYKIGKWNLKYRIKQDDILSFIQLINNEDYYLQLGIDQDLRMVIIVRDQNDDAILFTIYLDHLVILVE